jgi:NO-binding membrane sensor protein with MHYT domain
MFRQLKEKNKNLLRLKLKSALKIEQIFYYAESLCFKSVIILVKDKNTSLKLPVGVSRQIYALFIEFDYALFLFLLFKDMHYNTMIRTFCIMEKMTFTAFHYLNLSFRCEE